MKSLKELYRIGVGPSSSHTMAPNLACEEIKNKYNGQSGISYSVELFGSLADTGKGHGTDKAQRLRLTAPSGKNTPTLWRFRFIAAAKEYVCMKP